MTIEMACRRWVAGLLCLVGASAAHAAPVDDAIGEVATWAASELALESGSFERLAVLPFANDPGDRLTSAVIAALVRRDVVVLDRNNESVAQLIEELKRGGYDVYNAENAPQFGQFEVADAVLMGRVNEWNAGFLRATVGVQMKGVITETGVIVWSGQVSATRYSLGAKLGVAVVLVLVGLTVLFWYRRGRTRQTITSDEDIRNGISRSLQSARSQLATARAELEKAGDMNLLRSLRDVENDMDLVRKRVEIAPVSRPATMSAGGPKEVFAFDKQMLAEARIIEGDCRAVAEAALAGEAEAVDAQAEKMKLAVHRLRTALDERGNKMSGV